MILSKCMDCLQAHEIQIFEANEKIEKDREGEKSKEQFDTLVE